MTGLGGWAVGRRLDLIWDAAKEWLVLGVGLLVMAAMFGVLIFWVQSDIHADDARSRAEGRRWAQTNEATVVDCERRAVSDALNLYSVDRDEWFAGCRAVAER